MVEGVIKLTTQDEVKTLLQLDRFLGRKIPELEARRNECIAANVAIPGCRNQEVESVRRLRVARVTRKKASDNREIRPRSREAEDAAVEARGIERRRRIPQIWSVVVKAIAVDVQAVVHSFWSASRKGDGARGLPPSGDGVQGSHESVTPVVHVGQFI